MTKTDIQHPLQAFSPRSTPISPSEIWSRAMGPDQSVISTTDPEIRISNDGLFDSPGRTIGKPKKNSSRNTLDFRDPTDNAIKRAEGTIEMKMLYQMFRDPNVVKLECQFGPCTYIDELGKQRVTYWDARVTYADGFRLLVAAKPAAISSRKNYPATVEHMFSQMPPAIADAATVVTERDMPQWAVANGRLIHTVLNDDHWVYAREMREAADLLIAPVSIAEFCEPFGGVTNSFRTAIYLIAKCVLETAPGLITADSLVEPHAKIDLAPPIFGSRQEADLLAGLAEIRALQSGSAANV